MPQSVIIIRTSFLEIPEVGHLKSYFENAWKALQSVPGYQAGGVWKDWEDSKKHLILYFYESPEAAEEGLKVITKTRLLVESQSLPQEPSEVMRIRVVEAKGILGDQPTSAQYLSFSMRIADPGRACELKEDLSTVFAESTLLEGFCGHLIGVNDVLEEEVIGLAAWNSPESYAASLPQGILYTVRLYERLL